jgi:serine/threonine protein kinase
VTLFVCATGSLPFIGEGEEYEQNVLYQEPSYDLLNKISDSSRLLSLLKGMLNKNNGKRLTINQCVLHSFFE